MVRRLQGCQNYVPVDTCVARVVGQRRGPILAPKYSTRSHIRQNSSLIFLCVSAVGPLRPGGYLSLFLKVLRRNGHAERQTERESGSNGSQELASSTGSRDETLRLPIRSFGTKTRYSATSEGKRERLSLLAFNASFRTVCVSPFSPPSFLRPPPPAVESTFRHLYLPLCRSDPVFFVCPGQLGPVPCAGGAALVSSRGPGGNSVGLCQKHFVASRTMFPPFLSLPPESESIGCFLSNSLFLSCASDKTCHAASGRRRRCVFPSCALAASQRALSP